MLKKITLFGALLLILGASSCATLSADEAAKMVGYAQFAAANATGGGAMAQYNPASVDNPKMFSEEALSTDPTITTNSEGVITITYPLGSIELTYREPSLESDNWINQILGFKFGTDSNSFSLQSDMSEQFLSNGNVIAVTSITNFENNFGSLNVNGAKLYGDITLEIIAKGDTYSLSGDFGNSKSDPFTLRADNTSVDGPLTIHVVHPDLDQVLVYMDFDQLSMNEDLLTIGISEISYYPVGTVTGYVESGKTRISYTMTCDGTQTAELAIGSKVYDINLNTGKTYENGVPIT